jgi:hypothetical protein
MVVMVLESIRVEEEEEAEEEEEEEEICSMVCGEFWWK